MLGGVVSWDDGNTEAAAVAAAAGAAFRRRLRKKKRKRRIATKATPPAAVPPAMAPISVLVLVPAREVVADGTEAVVAKLVVADAAEAELLADVPKNGPAMLGFEDKNAAVRLMSPQPAPHAFALQQPRNGGLVPAQVYHSDPVGHSWSGKVPYAPARKEAGLRFPEAQPVESHGFVSAQQPTNLEPLVQAKKVPPLGQEGWNGKDEEDIEGCLFIWYGIRGNGERE